MTSSAPPNGSAFVFGVNHRTSGLSLRDRLFVEDADLPTFLDKMSKAGLVDALVLSTCDRVEVQGVHSAPSTLVPILTRLFADHSAMAAQDLEDKFYLHQGPKAIRHMFAVASSLDSLIVGEPQVLGQLKAAHRIAKDAGMINGPFEGVLQSAYGTAKRVRTETAIGERPVSIAAAACDIARGLHGDLSRLFVTVLGVGEMGELIARQFQGSDIKGLSVSHPMAARAERFAERMACHFKSYEEVSDALAQADIIICALGQRSHSLSVDMVRAALKKRRNRPQLIIDTAIPGDVEPAVNRIDDAFLYDLADLERVALEGKSNRETEAEAAHQLVDQEVQDYIAGHAARDAVPALISLRGHFEKIQKAVLEEHPDDAARATDLLIARLLHHPSQVLRDRAASGIEDLEVTERLLRDLFDLNSSYGSDHTNKENDG